MIARSPKHYFSLPIIDRQDANSDIFNEFLNAKLPYIRRKARLFANYYIEADDLVAVALKALYDDYSIKGYIGSGERKIYLHDSSEQAGVNLAAYINKVLRNRAIDARAAAKAWKRGGRCTRQELSHVHLAVDDDPAEFNDLLENIEEQLPKTVEGREMVVAMRMRCQGYKVEEIAQSLKVSERTAERRLASLREHLSGFMV